MAQKIKWGVLGGGGDSLIGVLGSVKLNKPKTAEAMVMKLKTRML